MRRAAWEDGIILISSGYQVYHYMMAYYSR